MYFRVSFKFIRKESIERLILDLFYNIMNLKVSQMNDSKYENLSLINVLFFLTLIINIVDCYNAGCSLKWQVEGGTRYRE